MPEHLPDTPNPIRKKRQRHPAPKLDSIKISVRPDPWYEVLYDDLKSTYAESIALTRPERLHYRLASSAELDPYGPFRPPRLRRLSQGFDVLRNQIPQPLTLRGETYGLTPPGEVHSGFYLKFAESPFLPQLATLVRNVIRPVAGHEFELEPPDHLFLGRIHNTRRAKLELDLPVLPVPVAIHLGELSVKLSNGKQF